MSRPRILVVRRRYLGDTVLLEPLLRNLRARWPAAWIAVAVDSPYVEIFAGSREVDEVLEVPHGPLRGASRKSGWGQLAWKTGVRPYDIAIDLAHNELSQAVILLSRARRRLALELLPSRVRRRWVYTEIVSVPAEEVRRTHAVDLNNKLLERLGIAIPARVPVLEVDPRMRQEASGIVDELWERVGRPAGPTLLVHPGAGPAARRWPPEYFAFVADMAAGRLEAHVILLDGPAERGLADGVRALMVEPASVLRAPLSLPLLSAVLSQGDLLLCNDSGPMHLAAAVGTPVCALYGAQSRATWGPLGSSGHGTFQADLHCANACVDPGACSPDDPMKSFCIRRIPPESVASAVHAGLARRAPHRQSAGKGGP